MTREFASLEDLGKAIGKLAADYAKDVAVAVGVQIPKEAIPALEPATPVGSPKTKDRKPGRMRRSWKVTPANPEAALRAKQWVNVAADDKEAPHAVVIDRGRKRGKSARRKKGAGTGKTPMLGSPSARSGVTRPVGRQIMRNKQAIIERAARELGGDDE